MRVLVLMHGAGVDQRRQFELKCVSFLAAILNGEKEVLFTLGALNLASTTACTRP